MTHPKSKSLILGRYGTKLKSSFSDSWFNVSKSHHKSPSWYYSAAFSRNPNYETQTTCPKSKKQLIGALDPESRLLIPQKRNDNGVLKSSPLATRKCPGIPHCLTKWTETLKIKGQRPKKAITLQQKAGRIWKETESNNCRQNLSSKKLEKFGKELRGKRKPEESIVTKEINSSQKYTCPHPCQSDQAVLALFLDLDLFLQA